MPSTTRARSWWTSTRGMGGLEKLKEVIAFLYNRSGKEEMSAQELRLAMSMDLRWFSPKEAEEIV
ncbi:MAG: DUF2240 family protein, partial [Thermoplasmata archaeon]|nr:DUF2240 family protein [Thermoplasmata archaeon]